MKRRILLTAALPYANGDIHLGHLVEYIQADIWHRFQKLCGHESWFVCADDAHGTPIMLRAEAEKIPAEDLIRDMRAAHMRDFAGFQIDFDNYHSTHSDENRSLVEKMFADLTAQGVIVEREIQQLFDPAKQMFLPDRYVRGDCPRCQAPGQYGDSCEVCGSVYESTELKNPVSVLSGATPEVRPSSHYFLRLSGEAEALDEWMRAEVPEAPSGVKTPRLQREVANKLREWLHDGLRDWDISRDPPYFGFRIPGIDEEKYFYVWLDAPVGYMASFLNLCNQSSAAPAFDDFWSAAAEAGGDAPQTELYHFIGKDILYFHGLFWPMMLKYGGYRRPTRLFAHGFLTVNGEKMSKSRGTFIVARRYLESGLNPDALRYYYACKLGDRVEDIDLSLADFQQRVNGDLVGKLVNIPSRVAGFIQRRFDGRLDDAAAGDSEWLPDAQTAAALMTAFERRRYHEVIRLLMRQADNLNAYLDEAKPWVLAKDTAAADKLHAVCSRALRHFDVLIGYLSPVVPGLVAKVVKFLRRPPYQWQADGGIAPLPAGHLINPFSHLMERMEEKAVNALIAPEAEVADTNAAAPAAAPISIGDFARCDIRVATVVTAEAVAEADKLLRLTLDVGDGRLRQVFAGLKRHYQAEELAGKQVVYLANLKPRKMRFGESEGMVLAATDDENVIVLQPAQPVAPGAKVS